MLPLEEKNEFEIPTEASFIETFNEKKENVEWLEKVKQKYGDSIKKLSYRGNDFVIERVIDALNTRNRSNEICSIIDCHLEYYDKYSMGNILNINIKNEDILCQYWPIYLCGNDKYGHPVFYDDLMSSDLSDIVKIFSKAANGYDITNNDKNDIDKYQHDDKDDDKLFDLCCKFRLKFYAKMAKYKQIQSQKHNTIIFKHILVMDFSNFSYYKTASNISIYSKIAKSVLYDEQLLYPQTVYKIYLINCPWSFTFIWKIVSNFIDPLTIKKIKILGNDYLEEMLHDIDIEQIPMKYGGNLNI